MKIYLPINKNAQTGKGLFINRLAIALQNMGIDFVSNPNKKSDIALYTNTIKKGVNSKIHVVRFDGAYCNVEQNYKALNTDIAEKAKKADAVIYQSEFAQKISEKYIYKSNKPKVIIYNGADPKYFQSVESVDSNYGINFLAFSKWRPHKRLKDILLSFVVAEIPDSCLWVAGDLKRSGLSKRKIKRYFKRNDICYLGPLNFEYLAKYIVCVDAVLHLCWFDCCPNSVVESICANKIVICNNVGGTHEIVKPSGGIVCEIDKPYNLEPVDLYNPPKINLDIVAGAIRTVVNERFHIENSHVDIKNIAQQYIQFFRQLLGG